MSEPIAKLNETDLQEIAQKREQAQNKYYSS